MERVKKSTSGGEGRESDQCWQLKSSDYNRREQRRGERMDQSSDGEYERREEKCRGSAAGWVLERRVPLHTPRLSRSLFPLTHSRLSFSPSDRELSLAVVSLWPSPLSPTAGTWLDDTAQHCIAGEGRHQPPTHTHIHTPIWPKQHCSPFPLSVCRSPSRLPVIQQCFTYSYLHGNINAAVYCAIIRPYS